MLGDLFYRLGTAAGWLDAQFQGKAGAGTQRPPREVAVYDTGNGEAADIADDGTVSSAALMAASAWLLSRFLRPRPVSWPRVALAGVAAAGLSDFVGRALAERPQPGDEPYATDSDELMARLGAGVAIAAGYAALLYPRLPGPPLLRGLLFGALEVAAAPSGGLVRLARETPGVKFPLETLALPVDEDAGPAAHMAFGLGLGLFYRYD
ncbi:MAG: hypothetical protein ACOCVZ_10200 [Gemmatimonadota bacterium]